MNDTQKRVIASIRTSLVPYVETLSMLTSAVSDDDPEYSYLVDASNDLYGVVNDLNHVVTGKGGSFMEEFRA